MRVRKIIAMISVPKENEVLHMKVWIDVSWALSYFPLHTYVSPENLILKSFNSPYLSRYSCTMLDLLFKILYNSFFPPNLRFYLRHYE